MFWLSLLPLALMIVGLLDIITRDDGQVKHLPKIVWILLVVLLPLIGTVLWFAVGREYAPRPVAHPRGYHDVPMPPPPPRDTRSTEQQLADLEREIEEERLRAEIARRRRARDAQAADPDEALPGSAG